MVLTDQGFKLFECGALGLNQKKHFFALGALPLPPIMGFDGSGDVDAGGKALGENEIAQF